MRSSFDLVIRGATIVDGTGGARRAPLAADPTPASVVAAMSTGEQIPEAAILAGVPFDWDDLASYMARLDAVPVLVNHAPLIGHVPLRAAVLGVPAVHDRPATADEIDAM